MTRFDLVPAAIAARARLQRTPVLSPGVNGMTLGRLVLLRRGHERSEKLIAHELVHVRQWAELGVPRFLVCYLRTYLLGLVRLHSHRRAYLAIPLEEEARRETAAWVARTGA